MKRQHYFQPECTLVPLQTHDNLMGIEGSTGTGTVFGKKKDFEEDDFDGYDLWKNELWVNDSEDKKSNDALWTYY